MLKVAGLCISDCAPCWPHVDILSTDAQRICLRFSLAFRLGWGFPRPLTFVDPFFDKGWQAFRPTTPHAPAPAPLSTAIEALPWQTWKSIMKIVCSTFFTQIRSNSGSGKADVKMEERAGNRSRAFQMSLARRFPLLFLFCICINILIEFQSLKRLSLFCSWVCSQNPTASHKDWCLMWSLGAEKRDEWNETKLTYSNKWFTTRRQRGTQKLVKYGNNNKFCIKLEKELPNSSTQKLFKNLRLGIKNWSGASQGNNWQYLMGWKAWGNL